MKSFLNNQKQIADQTRPPLDHVFIPNGGGYIFINDANRQTIVSAVLQYRKRVFVLNRPEGFLINREKFTAYGGDYYLQTLNSYVDGSLRDSNIISYANIEYSAGFIANQDASVSFPYELSNATTAHVVIERTFEGQKEIFDFPINQRNGSIRFDFRSGAEIRIYVYFYNGDVNLEDGTVYNGSINIFAGIGQYVGSWLYVDVEPPATPVWANPALVTEAADPVAGTTKISLRWLPPVVWSGTSPTESGVLVDRDLAGHNIYRIKYTEVVPVLSGSNGGYRIDSIDKSNSVFYSGGNIGSYVHGSTITASTNTVGFLARYNNTPTDEFGLSATVSGSPSYRSASKFGEYISTQKLTNPYFTENFIENSIPSGWFFSGVSGGTGGCVATRLSPNVVSVQLNHTNALGYVKMYQNVSLAPSQLHSLYYGVGNLTSGNTTISVYNNSLEIASVVLSGTSSVHNGRLTFRSSMSGVMQITVSRNGSGICYINQLQVYDEAFNRSCDFGSETINYIRNGSFENGFTDWINFFGVLNQQESLFGTQTPTVFCGASVAFANGVTVPNSSGTLSCYLRVYSGQVAVNLTGRTSGINVTAAQNSGVWNRYAYYYGNGNATVIVSGVVPGTVFSIDGLQWENGKRLTSFVESTYNGASIRSGSFLSYPASGVFDYSQGTIRLWYHPNYINGDFATSAPAKRIVTYYNGGASEFVNNSFGLYYNPTNSGLEFYNYRIATALVGTSAPFTNRNVWHHIVITWTQFQEIEMWLNGVRVQYNTTTYPLRTFIQDALPHTNFYVGGTPINPSGCADGMVDSLLVEKRRWSAQDILADYYAGKDTVSPDLTIIDAVFRPANKVYNGNFASRNSLTDLHGWAITTNGTNVSMSGSYNNPRFSDISLHIKTT